nr:MAG: DNA pilot protein [Microviridae sp.]
MPIIEQLGMQAASGLVNGAVGAVFGQMNDNRQLNQQQKLQDMQMQGQKEMTDYNQAAALKMWQDTNYPAQVSQLEKAGLNPGLLYGKGGGGGATASVSPGNVAAGEAPKGGGEITAMAGLGMQTAAQLELLKAQKENIEADTANKIADNPNLSAKTPNIVADTNLKGSQKTNVEADTNLKTAQEQSIGLQNAMTAWLQGTTPTGENADNTGNSIAAQQKIQDLKLTAQNAINAEVDKRLKEAGINVNEAQINKMSADIMQRAQEIKIQGGQLDLNKANQEFNNNWQTILGKSGLNIAGDILGIIAHKKIPMNK